MNESTATVLIVFFLVFGCTAQYGADKWAEVEKQKIEAARR